MSKRYSRVSTAVVLLVGVVVGWSLSLFRPTPLSAGAGDRLGESIVTTGPVLVRYDKATESSATARCRLHSRLQGGPAGGDVAGLPPIDCGDDDPRIVRRARPGRRLQAGPGHRTSAALHDDNRLTGAIHGRLGSALCRRDHEQADGGVSHPAQETTGKSSRPKFELVADQVLRGNERSAKPAA